MEARRARLEEGEGRNNGHAPRAMLFRVPRNTVNPMLIPIVISRLFDLCERADLANFRGVSPQWYDISLSRCRRELTVTITQSSNPPPRRLGRENPLRHLEWKTLGNTLAIGREQPFRSFCLDKIQFFSLVSQCKPANFSMRNDLEGFGRLCRNQAQFWTNYGVWIHRLELKDIIIEDVETFERVIFEETPNLQELTVSGSVKGGRLGTRPPERGMPNVQPNLNLSSFNWFSSKHPPVRWSHIFAHFPNIQKFGLCTCTSSFQYIHDGVSGCLESLERLATNPNRRVNLSITELTLLRIRDENERYVKGITRLPFLKLEKLDLDVSDCDGNDSTVLVTTLDRHSSTLKELTLRNTEFRENFHHPGTWAYDLFPFQTDPFPSLTKLELVGLVSRNFHFLEQMPNLVGLKVEQYMNEKMLEETNWAITGALRLSHLRSFYFVVNSKPGFYLLEEVMERFVGMMPNVETFTGQLSNASLRVLCQSWRELRKLEIVSGWEDRGKDDPEPRLERIDDEGVSGVVPGVEGRLPSIVDLKKLRHLTIQHMFKLAETSVFEGFLKLPHLISLDVSVSGDLSFQATATLYRHIPGGGSVKIRPPPECNCDTCRWHRVAQIRE